MAVGPVAGSTAAPNQEAEGAPTVPPSVTAFLKSATIDPFNLGPDHNREVLRVANGLDPQGSKEKPLKDFFVTQPEAFNSPALMTTKDESGNTYLLFPHRNNLWNRNMAVYGVAIAANGDRAVLKGVMHKKVGGFSGMTLEATGEVFTKAQQVELHEALRHQRAEASKVK